MATIERRYLVILALALALVAGACGSSKKTSAAPASTTTTTADPAKAKAEITANWQTFFGETTPVDVSVTLLQNGEKHRKFLQDALDKGLRKGTSVKVKDITFEDPTTAVVTYDLFAGGNTTKPALADSKGRAVLVGGKWVVSEEAECALEALGNGGQPTDDCK